MNNEVTNAKAWKIGYNTGIDTMERILLTIAADPSRANIQRMMKTIKPVDNPYGDA